MSIIFSRPCEYALQAVVYLAQQPQGEMTSIKELSARFKVPYHSLSKILQTLVYKGILTSMTGPTGGFALAVPARKIKPLDIIAAIDGEGFLTSCIMGFPHCSSAEPCAVHRQWENVRAEIRSMLVDKNIQELAESPLRSEYL